MKKSIVFVVTAVFLFSSHPSRLHCQTAEEILEKMIEAQGGRETLEKIVDTTLSGTMEMVLMGLGGVITTYQKEPNKLRMDATVQNTMVTQAFDGQTAWMTNPITGMAEEMPEPMSLDFTRSALGNDAFLNPGKYGISYTLEGKKTIEGKVYYLLIQNFSDGFKVTLFIDLETSLMYKTENISVNEIGQEVLIETVFSDYRIVDGITLAHTFVTYQDGEEFMRMDISEVKFNANLEDSFFVMKKTPGLPQFSQLYNLDYSRVKVALAATKRPVKPYSSTSNRLRGSR